MLLNIKLSDIIETSTQYTKNLPLAFLIGALFIYELFTIMPLTVGDISIVSYLLQLINNLNALLLNSDIYDSNVVYNAINPIIADTTFTNFLQIQAIGQNLYTMASVWLILTSVILLLAMIAPIFITKTANDQKLTSN